MQVLKRCSGDDADFILIIVSKMFRIEHSRTTKSENNFRRRRIIDSHIFISTFCLALKDLVLVLVTFYWMDFQNDEKF